MSQTDKHIHSLLVSPSICRDLQAAGLTNKTIYLYRQYFRSNMYHVVCPLLDPLDDVTGTFLESHTVGTGVKAGYTDYPAYTLMDVINAIPGVIIQSFEDYFEVSSPVKKNLFSKDERLPDAVAKFVLYTLEDKTLDPVTINAIILNTAH